MSETSVRKMSSTKILSLIGMGFGWLVFLGGMWMGMSIDPRVDLPSRLLAYTTALGGITTVFACRWAMAEGRTERIAYAALTVVLLGFFIGYGAVML